MDPSGILLLFALAARQPRGPLGYDYLALKHQRWPIAETVTLLPYGSHIGTLTDDTFGKDNANIVRLLKSGKVRSFRVHLANGSCLRNRKCERREMLSGFTPATLNAAMRRGRASLVARFCGRAEIVNFWAQTFPSVRFYLSGILEHNLERRAASRLLSVLKRCAPSVTAYVDNPERLNYRPIRGALVEQHGVNVLGDIVSLDGVVPSDVRLSAWLKKHRTKRRYIWRPSFNCRPADNRFEPPLERTHCPKPGDLL